MATARHAETAERWRRTVLAIALAVVGGYSVSRTVAYSIRSSIPEQAHSLAPEDGRITALLAVALSGADADHAARERADRLARQALRQDPTTVSAAATLGLNAQIRGDASRARRLFLYAQQLSRRNVQAEIWAIEDAVRRNDIPDVLRHYDTALRTSRGAPNLLFPILAPAITEPEIRVGLVKTIARKPVWYPAFLSYVALNSPNPVATADLFRALRRARVVISDDADSALIYAFLKHGSVDAAWTYYATIRPIGARDRSRDPTFAIRSAVPTPFDWMPLNEGGAATSIQSGESTNVFDFAAPPGVGAALLTQMQVLPPGSYRLDGRSEEVDQPDESRPYWALICQNGKELGRIPLPNSMVARGQFSGQFDVPSSCPVQALTLIARPSSAVAGLVGRIDRVSLSPIR